MTKIFGRDQFFCLNFGRDQKLGEENEKGYNKKYLFCAEWLHLGPSYPAEILPLAEFLPVYPDYASTYYY